MTAAFDPSDVARHAATLLGERALRPPPWKPEPHQVPPPGDWYGWLLLAGRGAGKTDACAHYVAEHVKGPPCLSGPAPHWIGIIAPTLGDAVTACYAGPSGIRAHSPDARLRQSAGGTVIQWENGSEAKLFGASNPEDVERLRAGGNRCLAWLEELAAWRYLQACWEQMRFGLRSGVRPHWIASSTPKPRPLIKKLAKETPHDVVVTKASTDHNPHLEASIRSALYEEYGGQQIGRQELHAEVLEEDAAALWTREVLERTRVAVRGKPDLPETFSRLTVGVDPSGGAGEQGIVVVGRASIQTTDERGRPARHSEGFVLADKTVCLDPHGWSRAAIRAAIEWEADDVVVERNYGGAMAMSTLLDACDDLGVALPVREVTASRGKRVRAEPVSAMTNRDRWHLAGYFPELEDQMCTWTVDADYSPDRLDAMVWPAWHMGLVSVRSRGIGRLPLAEFAETQIG